MRKIEEKTSGPALALANNRNAANGERRFHAGLYRCRPVRSQAACWTLLPAPAIGKILLNMFAFEAARAGQDEQRVTIWPDSPRIRFAYLNIFARKKKMRRDKKEVEQAKQHTLVNHYRAIGPAAIVAALLHTTKTQKPSQKFILPRVA